MAKKGLGSDKMSEEKKKDIARKGGEARGRQEHEEAEDKDNA